MCTAYSLTRSITPAVDDSSPGGKVPVGNHRGPSWELVVRFRWIYLAPLMAFIALCGWALASPVGASPDDDHHLVSIWCASGDTENCLPGTDSTTRVVPPALLNASCYALDPAASGACELPAIRTHAYPTQLTDRGNFQGAYPPVYYAVMGSFASPNIESSALVMRVVNAALFVLMVSLTYWLIPSVRRPALVWGWLVTSVPLGVFLIASNNPSGWAIAGVGTAWATLLGYFETTGRPRIGLGALFLVSVLMAAGSRADSALYVIVAIGAVLVLTFTPTRAFLLKAVLPAAGVLVAAAFLLTSSQIGAGVNGFGDPGSVTTATTTVATQAPTSASALLGFNLLSLPHLWAGVFGSWGLGWLDTAMPPIVMWSSAGAFIAVCFTGMARIGWRKGMIAAGIGVLLIVIPLYVLAKGADPVGANVQPRYLLPLIVLLASVLMLDSRGSKVRFGRAQVILVAAALSASNLVALHTTMRRFITGTDEQGLNLNASPEWWWQTSVSPLAVWAVGSVAFAITAIILAREVSHGAHDGPDIVPQADSSVTA